jgi:hypothetical protein
MDDKNVDAWIRMYEEQTRHGRHHEKLRSQATNLIIAVSAAILAFMSSEAASAERTMVLAFFLIVVNIYGLVMSLKHYERNRMHVAVAGKYRDVVSAANPINGTTVNAERAVGKADHAKSYPVTRAIRAYILWSGLHAVLALLGAFVLWVE